ncbi:hypothetical protein D3C71_1702900 [compost metagenome]
MRAQALVVPRFREELVDGPLVDRVGNRLQLGVARQHHANRVRVELLGAAKELDPGHSRHALVRDDDVNGVLH